MPTRCAVGLLLGVFVLLLGAGCSSDQQPTPAPCAPVSGSGDPPMFIPSPPASMPAPQATVYSATKILTATFGGEIAAGGMRVRFPAGSLPCTKTITLVVQKSEFVKVSLQPAGITLTSPAILQLDDLTKTDGPAYHGLAFYKLSGASTLIQPTSNDWKRPQAWVSTTGDFVLCGTRWDIPGLQFIRYLSGTGYVTQLVRAASGGTVSCDRIKVTVPPGALNADTYITIHQTSVDGALVAVLEPHGIQFQSAVTLEINLTGLTWQPYTDWTIYWLNEATDSWENQGGVFAAQKVTGSVWHFSSFAPARGRAGW